MDQQASKVSQLPNYHRIYSDMITSKYPDRVEEFTSILFSKKKLTYMDVIAINKKLFGNNLEISNQKLRSYSQKDIQKILNFQVSRGLNNSEIAKYFNVSRNSIAKWKKIFQNK